MHAGDGRLLVLAVVDKSLLLAQSPTSLKVTLLQLQRGKVMSLETCFTMEHRIGTHMMVGRACCLFRVRDGG